MRILPLLALLFFAVSVSAQSTQTISDEKFVGARFDGPILHERRLKRSIEVLELAENFARERGIETKRITLTSPNEKPYEALVISSEGTSAQNLEAKRVATAMSNLPLVFSPLDLSFGSEAYFMPDGSHLGVPYDFFTANGTRDSSYLHELQHAETQRRMVNGETPLWGGSMRLHNVGDKTAYVSSQNSEGYARLASLDEILTTALSVRLATEEVLRLRESLPVQEFNAHHGPARPRLASVQHSATLGVGLAKQTADLAARALEALDSVRISKTTLTIGTQTADLYESVFLLDAFEYDSKFKMQPIANGTAFTLYSSVAPTEAELRQRLETIRAKSLEAEAHFKAVLKPIAMGLYHVEMPRSDFDALKRVYEEPLRTVTEAPLRAPAAALTCQALF